MYNVYYVVIDTGIGAIFKKHTHKEQHIPAGKIPICPRPCHLDLESGVRVTCDVGYLCANFSLPMPLCSRLRPDARDRRQSSDTLTLNAPHIAYIHTFPIRVVLP